LNSTETNENTTNNQTAENSETTAVATAPPEKVNACHREISVEIPADVVARETESTVAKLQKMARIPGFRQGKVPATIVRQKFAEDIRTEVAEALIPKYFREEAERQKLVPITQPRVFDFHMHEGKPLRFKAFFETFPEIEVTGYQEIKPEKTEVVVTDEEVEQALKNLREQQATYVNVEEERPLQDGDFAQVSFKGSSQEEGAQPVEIDEVMVEIGGSNTIQDFSNNLRGAKVGEEREFDVTYPADFTDARLAGKTLHYLVAIKGIKNKTMPELNDDFAKELGEEFKSIDDLKTRIRAGMTAEKEHQAEHDAKNKMVESLVNKFEFDVPDAIVEEQINMRIDRGLRALAAQGMRAEDLQKLDAAKLREGQREAARREVRASLLLGRIAEVENIEVTDEEIDREIEAIALQAKQPADAVRARLTKDGALDRIRERIRTDKALDNLYRRSE
jgi:trigger factor